MTENHDPALYKDMLIVLATAGVVVPIMHRLKVTPVLGYLAAGALLGPKGLGALAATVPVLGALTITDERSIGWIGELGVVFLLFVIGLELSPQRLLNMRRLVFGLGGLQVLTAGLAIGAIAPLFGNSAAASVLIGLSLALSSTAVVLEWLSQHHRLNSTTGRATFSVLLFQDLAVVPILFLVGILGAQDNGSVTLGLLIALAQAGLALVAIFVLGRLFIQPLFRLVAETDSPELFLAATLLISIGTAVATGAAGLSMALGGFVAGLLLAETEYRKAVEATIQPFKGLLLGVFFILIGTRIDFGALIADPFFLIFCAAGVIVLKAALLLPLARLFRVPWPAAVEMSLLLGPCGEFAFIILGLSNAVGILPADVTGLLLAVVALTMAAIPLLAIAGRRIAGRVEARAPSVIEEQPERQRHASALVIGAGRVGQFVSQMLSAQGLPHVLADRDANAVKQARKAGLPVFYGDAKDLLFLKRCGLDAARVLIVTINNHSEINEIVSAVAKARPDLPIVARARDAEHARLLYVQGVTIAVPETMEASLQLSEASLLALGMAAGPVTAAVHEKRDDLRRELQSASRRSKDGGAVMSSQRGDAPPRKPFALRRPAAR